MSGNPVTPATHPWRIGLLAVALGVAGVVLVGRVVQLQVLQQDFLQGEGQARTVRTERMEAHRGAIVDRRGEPLAVSTSVETVWADPAVLASVPEHWPGLARATGHSEKRFGALLKSYRGKRFMYLRRHLAPAEAARIMDLRIPGVYSRREYRRYYPAGEVASHVVGITNIDDAGQEGLELSFDHHLAGTAGRKEVVKDRNGRVIRTLRVLEPPRPGRDIRTTLDLRIQYFAYRELKAVVRQHRARSGSVVVLDADSGDVLAMVNQPSVNPNDRGRLRLAGLRNRAITDTFEPGSTIKPFTVAAALEHGRVYPATRIDTSPGYMRVGRKTIRDHHDYGILDIGGILSKSSNVGVTRLALDMPAEKLRGMLHRVGFGDSAGTAFPGEQSGLLPSRRRWKDLEVATLAYGYGLSVTPLKLAEAYLVLANGGLHRPVRLVQHGDTAPARRVMDERVAGQVLEMLAGVVRDGGTGTRAAVAGYQVAGKTGTVHKVGSNGYEESEYLSLFAGIAPLGDPRLVVVVLIDAPSGEKYYGGEVAAPVFSRVVTSALRILNVAPDATPATVAANGRRQLDG